MKLLLIAAVALFGMGAAPIDWTKTVTRAPNGAFVHGNPKAKVRLVEYLSYSCSHCAEFSVAAAAPLKARYVAKGTVAVELRNAVRDRFDFAAAILARCGGAGRFVAQNEALFAAQAGLVAKATAHEETSNLPENTPVNAVLVDIAKGSGLTAFMVARGLSPATVNQCLTDKDAHDVVLGMTKEAWEERKLEGTPSFLINGKNTGPSSWAMLEPKLRAAVAAR